AMLEAFHHLDSDPACRNGQLRFTRRVEVMRFKEVPGTIEAVVGVDPGSVWSVGTPIFSRNWNSGCSWTTAKVKDGDSDRAHGFLVALLLRYDLGLSSSRDLLYPERSIAVAIRDESDQLAVGRPARIGIVEVAVGNREPVTTVGRHHP